MEDIHSDSFVGVHRYARSEGMPALIGAIAKRRRVDSKRILITAGATGASCDGDDLVGAWRRSPDPRTLLAFNCSGIVRSVGATPIEVPFLIGHNGSRTVGTIHQFHSTALYINLPNNPTEMFWITLRHWH